MSYYQKYRPRRIEELDLVSVRLSLLALLQSGKLSHAYLFVGPRGAGKTSTARILTQVINCEENKGKAVLSEACGKCNSCLSIANSSAVDVLEMDAASHRGIDDIRDLREKIGLTPVSLEKKVYIIDEVHMLTNEAFNALLKTLEEPPAHALFFLCTTEAHKVPETIVSRCVKINFTKATEEEVIRSLMKAVTGEKLKVADDVLKLIAKVTDGSFREGHKVLEQLATMGNEITAEIVEKMLGTTSGQMLGDLLQWSINGESHRVVTAFEELEKKGVKAQTLLLDLLLETKIKFEKEILAGHKNLQLESLMMKLIESAEKIKMSPLPLLPIEMALLSSKPVDVRERVIPPVPAVSVEKRFIAKVPVTEHKTVKEDNVVTHVYEGPLADINKIKTGWHELVNRLAPQNQSVAGLLRSAAPIDIEGKSLTIEVFYKFHKDQLDQDARKKVIEDEIAKIWGPISIKCILGEKRHSNQEQPIPLEKHDTVVQMSPVTTEQKVEDIFGV